MRRPLPDPTALFTALAGRVDVLERGTQDLRDDVAALGRGIAALTGQIRRLTGQPPTRPGSVTGPASSQPGADPGDPQDGTQTTDPDDEGGDRQRDWLTVTDPDTAVEWLLEVEQWARLVLSWHDLDVTATPCWPLHPSVVVELLALAAERDAAYAGPKPTPVSEWLARWLPAAGDRIKASLGPCRQERAHRHGTAHFDTTTLTTPAAGLWWATARDMPAPTALRLPKLP